MNVNEKKKEIIKIVKNILNEKINLNSSQANCKNWDSMSYFSILSSLEKKFKIKINQKNFNKFNSIKNILKNIK
jgi:acyl carrier protein|tara:strand:+ start:327 stop:548 length:222 start_codon:yes stop_codon:yes gene_type:complete